jgi:hypothetical protein
VPELHRKVTKPETDDRVLKAPMWPICRDKAVRADDQSLLAMQKVEGSSPFSRFEERPAATAFRAFQLAPRTGLGGIFVGRLPVGCQNPPAGKHCEGLVERASDEPLELFEAALPMSMTCW